jgi:hypothetical protein
MSIKPSAKEEEYFLMLDLERRKKIEKEKHKQMAEEEQRTHRELHFMRCPKCGMQLREVDFKGIKIDKCFACDGIWLDAGELDLISTLENGMIEKLFSVFRK